MSFINEDENKLEELLENYNSQMLTLEELKGISFKMMQKLSFDITGGLLKGNTKTLLAENILDHMVKQYD